VSSARKTLFRYLLLGLSSIVALGLSEGVLRWRETRATRVLLADASKTSTIPSSILGLYYALRPGATNEHFSFNGHAHNLPERPAQNSRGYELIAANLAHWIVRDRATILPP
jgi:hypothetical protein